MSAAIDVRDPEKPKRVAIIASNPATSKQTGWPIGFWWGELTHPYWEFVENGYQVEIFSPDGEYLSEWTDTQRPTHLVFDAQGRAYVSELWWHKGDSAPRQGRKITDPLYGRVSVFDRDGRLLTRWGTPEATAAGSFAAPHGIAVDSRGDIYVAEVTWTFAVSRGRVPANCHTFQKFTLKA